MSSRFSSHLVHLGFRLSLPFSFLALFSFLFAFPSPSYGKQPVVELSLPATLHFAYLPSMFSVQPADQSCQPIPGISYDTITPTSPPADRVAEDHADLNLSLRSYQLDPNAYLGMVDYGPTMDPAAPKLRTLFGDSRVANFVNGYQVHHWNWGCNCQGGLIESPDVTLLGLQTAPQEILRVPNSGYQISANGHEALVLYAEPTRITLKYTAEDNVVFGYTIHLENVCVEPSLLALYESWNEAGRGQLPALYPYQPFARAMSEEIQVAIRDTGAFQDPRSINDWWSNP